MTLAITPTPAPRRRRASAKVRQARRETQAQTQSLTHQITAAGDLRAAAVAQAKAVTQGHLTPPEIQTWLNDMQTRLQLIQDRPEQNLGHIEEQLALCAREPLRLIAQRAAQAKINALACQCPTCHRPLIQRKYLSRTIESRFGPLHLWRDYGWCAPCEDWIFPADHALGLNVKAPASPYLQEISALLVTKMPPEQATQVAERLGLNLSRCFLHREAHRQGLKAQAKRSEFVGELDAWEGLQQLARQTDGPPSRPFTLVIQIDAWNIRERDEWGKTEELRQQGEAPSRWHWVYQATVFRLDHRGQSAGERAFITQRGYVATRLGLDALIAQLRREAFARGLGQAQEVLVIADGGIWIWNLVKDRFAQARQRLDLWHADEHLWAIANDLYGRGTPEAAQWIAPLLKQIRQDQSLELIASLNELKPRLAQAEQEKLQTQIDYFQNNAHRMKYKEILAAREACQKGNATDQQIKLANEPLGSGAIESTCRQYQCRFKRTGQFWTTLGDEALLALETCWRNGRWTQLYPHALSSCSQN